MTELLPLTQAETIKGSLLDYLGTTFALADPDARRVLDAFLEDPVSGMFRGPYVRTRLPFRPAADGWREHLEWYEGFTPYVHQAEAFARLSSYRLGPERPRPLPTLVTTGTGSGKTEAFLYPILDHVRRANRSGVTGTKALILYPMNALANDQASRLAEMITEHTELGGITAALYTGEAGPQHSTVSADGLITSREVIRDRAPDILLTNYKMLDQLLLRPADAGLWRQSALSLQYLVLDEFHTYDGAQGTDVAMLLRRLGQTLKAHWPADHPELSSNDHRRPLGRITPVATSATLGDRDDPAVMLGFAKTVFGEPFPADAVITESRLSLSGWASGAADSTAAAGFTALDSTGALSNLARQLGSEALIPVEGAGTGEMEPSAVTAACLHWLYTGSGAAIERATGEQDPLVLDLVRGHPVFHRLLGATSSATALTDLDTVFDEAPGAESDPVSHADRSALLTALLTVLSHVRAVYGRGAASVDVHLWIRELTRINRAASGEPVLAWNDDGIRLPGAAHADSDEPDIDAPFLPAIYCRHCNRSGWGVSLAPTGTGLDGDAAAIRHTAFVGGDRFRALIHAPNEAETPTGDTDVADAALRISAGPALVWLLAADQDLSITRPDEAAIADGRAVPVLTDLSAEAGEASKKQTCPACRQEDGIRFLGSAIATMLSVSLSTLFGTPGLSRREKRALVFTDSVQDAAHRAGFVQSRSHALTLRTLIRQALDDGPADLETLAHRVLAAAGDDRDARYRLLPPGLAEREDFTPFWSAAPSKIPQRVRRAVLRRLMLDIGLEFGLRSSMGRTLEATGTALAYVDATESVLLTAAHNALGAEGAQLLLDTISDAELARWVRGMLVHMRRRGAIAHPWFDRYRTEGGDRWFITGGRARGEGMPGFGRGQSAPGFPSAASSETKRSGLEPVSSRRGWYARWTARVLGVTTAEGTTLARLLLAELARRDVLGQVTTTAGIATYHLPDSAVIARAVTADELADGRTALICDTCRDTVHSGPWAISQLRGGPCLLVHCAGQLQPYLVADGFYRQMYAATDIKRVVAREHTSLLPDTVRLAYETGFKQAHPAPDAPNVLVATPTLEMGIDIGDLSAVLLSSLPRTVASYLQRIGRAGRLTGNSLALAYVTGRGDQLPRFNTPGETINGAVRPPATYLDAEEILRRQFTASIADRLARDPQAPAPRTTPDALHATDPDSYLGHLIALAETDADELTAEFLAGFSGLGAEVTARLRDFVWPTDGPGTSELAVRCHRAVAEYRHRRETLTRRRAQVQAVLPELEAKAGSPAATTADKDEHRTAQATYRLLRRQLSEMDSEYWISALESAGLLPNYTLLDDTVELAVSVNWRDPETDAFEHNEFEIQRGAAQALRDFAPGSTFYAHGYAIAIDAVDLGADGEAVHTWACCGACGHTVDLTAAAAKTAPSACPRCASQSIADRGQRLDVVELAAVSAVIRREEATIDDASDERHRRRFTVVTAADIDPAQTVTHWFAEDLGLGARHLRSMTIRWLNLGSGGGGDRLVAGHTVDAGLFRVCSECGKLDRDTGANDPREHRPWCSLRTAVEEDVRAVALARTLRTEGLVLRLPRAVTLGDSFAVPSLSAALLLGLREHLGGAPDHLQIEEITDPSPTGADHEALLLHDTVPGGTGYLADLAGPDAVWNLLHRAWEVVRDCPCAERGVLACERCLLPFAAPGRVDAVSRAAAQHHLETLLVGRETPAGEPAPVPAVRPWQITEDEPAEHDDESALEKLFRVRFQERLEALGAQITQRPTDRGISWDISLGDGNRWSLRPQEDVLGSRPDFLLTSYRPGVPPTAIFTDGFAFHAAPGPGTNRLADDAEKRRNLRGGGYQVVAVTHDDLTGTPPVLAPLPDQVRAGIQHVSGGVLGKSTMDLAFGSALDLLVAWVQSPDAQARRHLGRWAPLFALAAAGGPAPQPTTRPLPLLALGRLDHDPATPTPTDPTAGDPGAAAAATWRDGTIAYAVRFLAEPGALPQLAMVLDDDDLVLGTAAKNAWRAWLHWANLIGPADTEPVISTRRHLATAAMTMDRPVTLDVSRPTGGAEVELDGAWRLAYDEVLDEDRELIIALARADLPAPTIGEEAADGIPLEISWPEAKVLVDSPGTGLDQHDRKQLTAAGWTVCDPDPDSVRRALTQRGL